MNLYPWFSNMSPIVYNIFFLRCNQSKSIIDHFIVSENIEKYVQEYYIKESVDNLSDHVPLYMLLECTIVDVSPEQDVILKEKPIWNLAKKRYIRISR